MDINLFPFEFCCSKMSKGTNGYKFNRKSDFMAKQKEIKTNAMRILDRMKIPYTTHTY